MYKKIKLSKSNKNKTKTSVFSNYAIAIENVFLSPPLLSAASIDSNRSTSGLSVIVIGERVVTANGHLARLRL